MANPILSQPGMFAPAGYGYPDYQNAARQTPTYGQQPPSYGQQATGYGQQPGFGYAAPQPYAQTRPATMTLDDVMNKAGIMLALLMISAGVAYVFVPAALLYPAALICGIVTIAFPFLVASRRHAAPGLCVAYSVIEGVFIGGISKIFQMYYPGIVVQAALGTFVAAAAVMIAFRSGGFRATPRMSQIVRIGLIGFAGVALLNLVLYLFGFNLGLFPGVTGQVSLLAWVFALIGVGLAVYSLLDDFTYIEVGKGDRNAAIVVATAGPCG